MEQKLRKILVSVTFFGLDLSDVKSFFMVSIAPNNVQLGIMDGHCRNRGNGTTFVSFAT